eukprot:1151818-Pelagomonas_calceolata.AAC.1
MPAKRPRALRILSYPTAALRKGSLTKGRHQGSLKTTLATASLGEGRDRTIQEVRAGCQQCPETPGLSFCWYPTPRAHTSGTS